MFFKSNVKNVSDPTFFRTAQPVGFIEQSQNAQSIQRFRNELPPELQHSIPNLAKAIALRHWVRQQQPDGSSWRAHPLGWNNHVYGDTENPLEILEQQRNGSWAICKRFAYLLVGAAESGGLRARVISVSSDFYKSAPFSHTMAEIWVPELSQWVLMDAMLDVMFLVDGHPASAVDIYEAVSSNRLNCIQTLRQNVRRKLQSPNGFKQEFRHLYVGMSNAVFDGYRVCAVCERPLSFAHLSNRYSPDHPQFWKQAALTAGLLSDLIGFAIVVLAITKKRTMFQHFKFQVFKKSRYYKQSPLLLNTLIVTEE